MNTPSYEPGDVLLLERPIAGIPWPTSIYVRRVRTEGAAIVSLVVDDKDGLYGIDNPYTISVEDLAAFSLTGRKARVRK